MKNEIPKKLLSLAEANYFCNVLQFIGLGENRTINNQQAGKVKRDFEIVGEWFSSLDDAGKARIIRFLEAEWEQDEATRRFFADPYKFNSNRS